MLNPACRRLLPLLAPILLLAPGCASIVTPGRFRPVEVNTHPPGAAVFVNEKFEGRTPLTLRVDRKEDHRLRVVGAGAEPFDSNIESSFNGWYLANFISWDIPGFLIDGINGSIWTPKPNSFEVYLLAPGGDYDDRDQREAAKKAWKDAEKQRKQTEREARRQGNPASVTTPAPRVVEPGGIEGVEPRTPATNEPAGRRGAEEIDFYEF